MALPPRPRGPGLYHFADWLFDPTGNFDRLFAKYGDMFTIRNPLFGDEVMVNHPELVKAVMTGDPAVFLGGEAGRPLAPIVGSRSILVLDGKDHERQRKLLLSPFQHAKMAAFADVMRASAERVFDAWPRGKPFSLLPSMQRITLDVILHCVFGASEGAEIEALREALVDVLDRAQSPLGMLLTLPALQRDLGPFTGWAGLKRAIAKADALIYAMIAERRASGKGRNDILSMLLSARDEAGDPMTDPELRDELVTLLMAGHETTATALCWAVDEIVRRRAVHDRIVAEATSPGGDFAYLDATIKEVLRLRPLVPLIARKVAKTVALGDYELPPGTLAVACAYLAQRHPAFWEAPAEFRPERFLGTKPHPYAWIPFGGGGRRCIGMAFALYEMRVVLAALLPRVPLELPDAPAKVALRSFLFAPARGPRVRVPITAQA
jgi:cytochrome P450